MEACWLLQDLLVLHTSGARVAPGLGVVLLKASMSGLFSGQHAYRKQRLSLYKDHKCFVNDLVSKAFFFHLFLSSGKRCVMEARKEDGSMERCLDFLICSLSFLVF